MMMKKNRLIQLSNVIDVSSTAVCMSADMATGPPILAKRQCIYYYIINKITLIIVMITTAVNNYGPPNLQRETNYKQENSYYNYNYNYYR